MGREKLEKTKKQKLRDVLASSLAGAMFVMIPAVFIVILFGKYPAIITILLGGLLGAIYAHVFE
jgi:hypothetical protein